MNQADDKINLINEHIAFLKRQVSSGSMTKIEYKCFISGMLCIFQMYDLQYQNEDILLKLQSEFKKME